jgi:hypothetical protein
LIGSEEKNGAGDCAIFFNFFMPRNIGVSWSSANVNMGR